MGTQKRIKNFQVRLYLEAWFCNVGFHRLGPEMTLHEAMSESCSLTDWFGTDNVDYDEDFALQFITEKHKVQEKR